MTDDYYIDNSKQLKIRYIFFTFPIIMLNSARFLLVFFYITKY